LVTGKSTAGNLPTGAAAAASSSHQTQPFPWLPVALLVIVVVVVALSVRNRRLANGLKRVLPVIAVLVAALLLANWVVGKYEQPGHMSVIDAQAMDMSNASMPMGQAPVATEKVNFVTAAGEDRLSATVVPYTDQTITARVPGTIVNLPVYAGQHVVPGELLVALGDRQYAADLEGKAAAVQMALHDVMISKLNLHQANQEVVQAQAGVASAQSQFAGGKIAVAGANAQVRAAQQQVKAARADLASARASVAFSSAVLARDRILLKGGSISLQEFQKDQAAARADAAKVVQESAAVEAADAMVTSAQSNVAQMVQNVTTLQAALQQAQANEQAVQDGASTMQHEIIHKQAAVQMAQADENSTATVASYAKIRANISGSVLQRLASPGMLVQPGQPILQIAQLDKVRVQAQIPAQDLSRVHVGAAVEITAGNNSAPIHARVTSVFPFADPASRSATIEAVVNNPGELLVPGEYVDMTVALGAPVHAVMVPQHAVVQIPVSSSYVSSDRTIPAVWIMTAKGTAHMVHVTTGPAIGGSVAVTAGLIIGDNVIVEGLQGLHEGTPVVETPWANGAPLTLPDPSMNSAPVAASSARAMPTGTAGSMKGMAGMGGMSK
jgi:RND family efflux transporter MFP subunit